MSKELTPDQLVGAAIQSRRVTYGASQGSFVERLRDRGLNWSQGTLSRVELGDRPVRLVEAAVVAEVLGVGLDVLLREGASTEDKLRKAQADLVESIIGIQQSVTWMNARLMDVEEMLELAPDSIQALGNEKRSAPASPSAFLDWLLESLDDIKFEGPSFAKDRRTSEAILTIADTAVAHSIALFTGPEDDDWELLRSPKFTTEMSGPSETERKSNGK
ncbi:hypothetical protein GCM10023063_28500 [Arthrobacter methylotrophus]|uniref:Helix-turn-helix domain-containing protein n=1 Tax=Arthrobacter methylotrophus TaxID=121291 RepID=A0ABV5UQI9_9MICC